MKHPRTFIPPPRHPVLWTVREILLYGTLALVGGVGLALLFMGVLEYFARR